MTMARLEAIGRHVCGGRGGPSPAPAAQLQGADTQPPPGGPLDDAALRFFKAFGFAHVRQSYSRAEMAAITERVDAHLAREGNTFGPVEGDAALTALLLEDDRMGGTVAQLMALYGEQRHLLATSSHLRAGPVPSSGWQGFSSLPAGTPPAQDEGWFEHGW